MALLLQACDDRGLVSGQYLGDDVIDADRVESFISADSSSYIDDRSGKLNDYRTEGDLHIASLCSARFLSAREWFSVHPSALMRV
jgi:hypothetical protein